MLYAKKSIENEKGDKQAHSHAMAWGGKPTSGQQDASFLPPMGVVFCNRLLLLYFCS